MAQQVATAPLPPAPGPAELATHALAQSSGQRPFRSPRHTYGALDLGTNNCRLLIARPAEDGFVVIDAFSRVVRLGEGLAGSGRIADAAMDRAVAALAVCAEKLKRRHVSLARSVATDRDSDTRRRRSFSAQTESAANARSIAPSVIFPLVASPSPSRTTREKASMTTKPFSAGRAISRRQLLVPRSSAP